MTLNREFVCNFIRHYMNATVKCDSDGDGLAETDAADEGLESIIVPIIFGIIFVVGFIGNLAVILVRTSL